jgi:hypothetical protein
VLIVLTLSRRANKTGNSTGVSLQSVIILNVVLMKVMTHSRTTNKTAKHETVHW